MREGDGKGGGGVCGLPVAFELAIPTGFAVDGLSGAFSWRLVLGIAFRGWGTSGVVGGSKSSICML